LSDKKVQFNEEVEVKTVEALPTVAEIDEVSQPMGATTRALSRTTRSIASP